MTFLILRGLKYSLVLLVGLAILPVLHIHIANFVIGKTSLFKDSIPVEIADYEEMHLVNKESNHSLSKLLTKQEFEKWYKKLTANIPLELLQLKTKFSDPKECTKFPDLVNLSFNNIYWQTLTTQEKDVAYFYSAYYDNRDLVENKPIIRIISVISEVDLPFVKYCQIWFKANNQLICSNVTSPITMTPFYAPTNTYILSCKIPKDYIMHIPDAVSLVENECDLATNVLKVNYNLPKDHGGKEDFAICIKGMDFPDQDLSFYLVEYIELAKLLGIHKIFLYDYDAHPNMSAVLRYYENQDLVQVIPITAPGTGPILYGLFHNFLWKNYHKKRVWARIAHNDCFYMNINRYKYIGFFDLDEIMIPYNGKTWKQVIDGEIKKNKLLEGSKYKPPSAYILPSASKSDSLRKPYGWNPDIPKYLFMLQNVYRTPISYGHHKQIIDTERNLGISNHRPLRCIGTCKKHMVPISEAYLSHFRGNCMGKCKNVTKDTNIWYYKEKMLENVDKSLKAIGLI